MKSVFVGKVGSSVKEVKASTVREAVKAFGEEGDFVVQVNGNTSSMDARLEEGNFVTIGEKIKGGL